MIELGIGSSLLDFGGKVIDKVFPDKEKYAVEREKFQLELFKAQQNGEFKELEARMSGIIAEAQSKDPWTSRARPSFLYVMYSLIGFAIPMGFISAADPVIATNIAKGMQAWLTAIPDLLYQTMTIGYLGYTGARTFEKRKGLAK